MISNHPARHPRKKKNARKKKSDSPVFDLKIVTDLRRQIDQRWPNLGRQLASLVQVSREKVDDVYCSAAQFITEHKEAFEDRLAERKAQDRQANPTPQSQEASVGSSRREVRHTVGGGAAKKNSAHRTPSRRSHSFAKQPPEP
jgi:hypothetical protein